MDGKFYTKILEKQIPEVRSMLGIDGGYSKIMILNILVGLLRNFSVIMSQRLWIGHPIVQT
jgi:hypothetical protein